MYTVHDVVNKTTTNNIITVGKNVTAVGVCWEYGKTIIFYLFKNHVMFVAASSPFINVRDKKKRYNRQRVRYTR